MVSIFVFFFRNRRYLHKAKSILRSGDSSEVLLKLLDPCEGDPVVRSFNESEKLSESELLAPLPPEEEDIFTLLLPPPLLDDPPKGEECPPAELEASGRDMLRSFLEIAESN